jgi:hypothetical protein
MNKHVFKKIAELEKTQLSEINVELGLIDDFEKANSESLSTYSDWLNSDKPINNLISELKKYANDSISNLNKYKKQIDSSKVLIAKIENMYNELGIDIKTNKNYSLFDKIKKMQKGDFDKFISGYNDILKIKEPVKP